MSSALYTTLFETSVVHAKLPQHIRLLFAGSPSAFVLIQHQITLVSHGCNFILKLAVLAFSRICGGRSSLHKPTFRDLESHPHPP